ncbi:TlpA disulfide reductase family protein [Olleya sp. UBA1516]|uniref:peroxiredoxin family protein n=1 Tax=Olleya sp. UBA1516 TaxID=1947013 RepID=UPI0025D014A2|nr:TlpA disulfide reductase family protein [Olleya sp. UBA1516]|tara:strand:+ start:45292 stop:46500 length:1209 start_codon:yes stop_codon:yes gene_type:complete
MRQLLVILVLFSVLSCQNNDTEFLTFGTYRGELKVNDTKKLPFIFNVKDANALEIYNAEEVITVDEIEYKNDSVYIKLPVFEGLLIAKIKDQTLNGRFVVEEKGRQQAFTASKNESRFDNNAKAETNITGEWETVFSPNTEADKYVAKGVFKQNDNIVTGTFLTETGDYRYLEGIVDGNQLQLSTFDGAHAFLFTGTVTDSTINGQFYSGNHWKEPFTAKRNDNYQLASANNLTYLKEGYDTLAFSFPDTDGKQVSLKDDRFKNKVVVVQIMGTWCPNCLDESKFYTQYYNANKDKDIQFVALAFEYAKTEAKAYSFINRLKDRLDINYPILLAQTGSTSKTAANDKLPMLNHVLSYPTSIFIDKTGKVRKIHTGFNGPATGDKYTEFKTEFNAFMDMLLTE